MSTTFSSIEKLVRSIYPGQEEIPLHVPVFVGNEKKYLAECIESTYVSYVGPFVSRLEEKIADYANTKFAIACINGTAALHLSLLGAGVQPGDEVITQALTFVATSNAIVHAGARPVFLDVEEESLCLDPKKLCDFFENNTTLGINGECINKSTGARIGACVPVHVFGHIGGIKKIVSICHDYGVKVIEDAAEALGSFLDGKSAGSFGDAGVLSFNGNKAVTAGAGGIVLSSDLSIAEKIRHLSTTAKVPHPWEYEHNFVGYNYRMSNLNAAVACAQLEYIDQILISKREIAAEYSRFFDSTDIRFLTEPPACRSNYWLNTIVLENFEERNSLLEYLNQRQIFARAIWKLMTSLPMYKDCEHDDLSTSEYYYQRAVCLPSSAKLQ